MVSFLHAADLHLGLRVTRFKADIAGKIREARFQALEKIRETARDRGVSFTLIAGDLFDDHAVDHDVALRAFQLLESFPTPVYVLSGNHDPLLPGSVWDRPPWNAAQAPPVSVLRVPQLVQAADNVVLLPCPVFRKTCLQDPTDWLTKSNSQDGSIRIGIAHGGLRIRPNLPPDDHLIASDAAVQGRLDYLALGHWHRRLLHPGADGSVRTAYCGVHEPFRFPEDAESRTGWHPYTSGLQEEFLDCGQGEVLHVEIDRPGAEPVLTPIQVGHFTWQAERYQLGSKEDLGRVINEIATRPAVERCLIRLSLEGSLDAEAMLQMRELRGVCDRYVFAELDETNLRLRPTPEQLQSMAGHGVLGRVFSRLVTETESSDQTVQATAERALLLMYELAEGIPA
jgi:DNA repair exonuclease SbcCD nuclease subunit